MKSTLEVQESECFNWPSIGHNVTLSKGSRKTYGQQSAIFIFLFERHVIVWRKKYSK